MNEKQIKEKIKTAMQESWNSKEHTSFGDYLDEATESIWNVLAEAGMGRNELTCGSYTDGKCTYHSEGCGYVSVETCCRDCDWYSTCENQCEFINQYQFVPLKKAELK